MEEKEQKILEALDIITELCGGIKFSDTVSQFTSNISEEQRNGFVESLIKQMGAAFEIAVKTIKVEDIVNELRSN